MQMPGITGIDFAKKTRNSQKFPKLPLILLSSIHVNFKAEEKSLFSSYLLKPARELKFMAKLT